MCGHSRRTRLRTKIDREAKILEKCQTMARSVSSHNANVFANGRLGRATTIKLAHQRVCDAAARVTNIDPR